jgi:hypothetical protein
MGSSFERPANRMVLISLFFFNLTKKRIPENKIIKIDSSMIVLGVLYKDR